jgi:hypothetical protein
MKASPEKQARLNRQAVGVLALSSVFIVLALVL